MNEIRVLIIEDYADAAEAQAELLKALGYRVEVASDGLNAVEVAHDFRPDVVLLDLMLPGKSGYEVGRELRARVSRPMVIIAVSGLARDVDRVLAADVGLDYYLTKPVETHLLANLLEMISQRRRPPQRAASNRAAAEKASYG